MIGAIFAAIWNAAVQGQHYDFTFNFNTGQVFSWVISLISLPMGLVAGLVVGLLGLLVASHTRGDHFDDFTYWLNDDGLRMFREGEGTPTATATPVQELRQGSSIIKGAKAYL
jgi:hypothetical protein